MHREGHTCACPSLRGVRKRCYAGRKIIATLRAYEPPVWCVRMFIFSTSLTPFPLSSNQEPQGLTPALQALWQDAKGNWDHAHDLSQQEDNKDGAWIHAYLHRKEGDNGNAAYWYSNAGKAPSRLNLEEEWGEIAETLLKLL